MGSAVDGARSEEKSGESAAERGGRVRAPTNEEAR